MNNLLLSALNEFRRRGINPSNLSTREAELSEDAFCIGYIRGLVQVQEMTRDLEMRCFEDINKKLDKNTE